MTKSKLVKTLGYKSVKDFQSKNGLEPDGIWGPKSKAKAKAIVVKVQAWLIFRGYNLTCDGILGSETITKVRKFQAFWDGLSETGIIDAKTLEALKPTLKKGYVSPHFKKSEFRCECGGKWCDGYNGKKVSLQLLGVLEMVRRKLKRPIIITSGIRCQRYNDSLPGSIPNSVHRLGGAADVYVPGIHPSTVKKYAYKYGAAYAYHGTYNMGNACHINI